MKQITKKLQKQIEYLNWNVEPTYEVLFRYLMEQKREYVMAFPTPEGWDAMIVFLGKPNKFDGKMNSCDIECAVKTYDDAIRKGVESAIEHYYRAYREMEKHLRIGDLDEFIEEHEKRLIESGFDL